jgi:hypothetical protein
MYISKILRFQGIHNQNSNLNIHVSTTKKENQTFRTKHQVCVLYALINKLD